MINTQLHWQCTDTVMPNTSIETVTPETSLQNPTHKQQMQMT